MNSSIYNGISLLIISVLVLIVGMIKPKWILMWMDNPGRMPILWIASALFMFGMVLFGQGTNEKHQAEAKQEQQQNAAPSAEVPAPAAVATPQPQ